MSNISRNTVTDTASSLKIKSRHIGMKIKSNEGTYNAQKYSSHMNIAY
jgi:hypothetical protein